MAESYSKLCFLTWNVNGLETALQVNSRREPERQKNVCEEMDKADVVFLQETHVKNDIMMSEFPDWFKCYTVSDKPERGVAIFIKRSVDFKYINKHLDEDGFVVLHCELQGQPYTLVCVYHHQKDHAILRRLSEYLQNNATGMLVIGGDFNTVFSPFVDKKEPTINQSHLDLRQRLKQFMQSLQLVDVWRWRHPFKRFYTFYRAKNPSRIDFFFVPEECLWRVQACEIEDVPTNDHLPVSLQLNSAALLVSPAAESTESLCKYNLPNQGDVRFTSEDITTAINSLQVSDTPRQDGIPASVYKRLPSDSPHLKYLQVLYSRILDGSFDGGQNNFSASVQWPNIPMAELNFSDVHFFNVDYIILATILARCLDRKLESQSRGHRKVNYDNDVAMIYYFCKVPESVEWSLLESALISASLLKDFQDLQRILSNNQEQNYLLYQGCPLTPSLHSLLLRYVTKRDLEEHKFTDIKIDVYRHFVNVVVPKGSPLGKPNEINMNGLQVRRNIATSLEHVYVEHKPLS